MGGLFFVRSTWVWRRVLVGLSAFAAADTVDGFVTAVKLENVLDSFGVRRQQRVAVGGAGLVMPNAVVSDASSVNGVVADRLRLVPVFCAAHMVHNALGA